MKKLMLFDLIAFGIALLLYVKSTSNIEHLEDTSQYMIFSRWIYGVLSFPFLIFNIPVCLNLLTHAKSTTYDKQGNCVPPKIDICY